MNPSAEQRSWLAIAELWICVRCLLKRQTLLIHMYGDVCLPLHTEWHLFPADAAAAGGWNAALRRQQPVPDVFPVHTVNGVVFASWMTELTSLSLHQVSPPPSGTALMREGTGRGSSCLLSVPSVSQSFLPFPVKEPVTRSSCDKYFRCTWLGPASRRRALYV